MTRVIVHEHGEPTERERFERWARSVNLDVTTYEGTDIYVAPVTHHAWQAWQARGKDKR